MTALEPSLKKSSYLPCEHCSEGKLSNFPSYKKVWIFVVLSICLVGLVLFCFGGFQLIEYKLKPGSSAISAKTPGVTFLGIGAAILFLFGGISSFFFGIERQIKGWLFLKCPACEEGFIRTNQKSTIQTVLFFLDRFFFHEILVPMYYALTFRSFWRAGAKKKKIFYVFRVLFHLLLFFGAIPFLLLLLGTKQILGFLFAFVVMFYLLSIIFFSDEEDIERKGIVFLVIPLYYVSMVELFRWAWVFSSDTIPPDMSELLFLGLENLIRTQIFLDFFEVYDFSIVSLDEVNTLAHTAIFITRLLLDAAVISILIRAFLFSFRKAWIYKNTGEEVSEMTDHDALMNVENLSIMRSSHKVEELWENLQQISKVLGQAKIYISGLVERFQFTPEKEPSTELKDCAQWLDTIENTEIETENQEGKPQALKVSILDRILSILFLLLWSAGFAWGLKHYIHELTQREIAFLMKEAEAEKYQRDPFSRLALYERVLDKDAVHLKALFLFTETMLDIANHHVNLFALAQGEKDVENFFLRLEALNQNEALKKEYESALEKLVDRAYAIRGKLYFLRKDLTRSLAELRKGDSDDLRRMRYYLLLYQASQKIMDHQHLNATDFEEAAFQIKEIADEKSKPLLTLGFSLYHASQGSLSESRRHLEAFLSLTSFPLKQNYQILLQKILVEEKAFENQINSSLEEILKKYDSLLQKSPSFFPFILGKANLLRRLDKEKESFDLLHKSMALKGTKEDLNEVYLSLGLLYSLQNNTEKAFSFFEKVCQSRKLGQGFLLNLKFLFAGKITMEEFEKRTVLWKPEANEIQRTYGYFYLGVYALSQKFYNLAELYFRRCLGPLEVLAEGAISRRELANLQLHFEKSCQESGLIFHPQLLSKLARLLQQEILPLVLDEKTILGSLSWIMEGEKNEPKAAAITDLAVHKMLSFEALLPFLKEGLQAEDFTLKEASLEALVLMDPRIARGAKTELLSLFELTSEEIAEKKRIQNLKIIGVKLFSLFGEEGVDVLITALDDSDIVIQRTALESFESLGFVEATKALPLFEKKLMAKEFVIRKAAFEAILTLEKNAIPVLIKIIETGKDLELCLATIQFLETKLPLVYQENRTKITRFLWKVLPQAKEPRTKETIVQQLTQMKIDSEFLQNNDGINELLEVFKSRLEREEPYQKFLAAQNLLTLNLRTKLEIPDVLPYFLLYLETLPGESQQKLLDELFSEEKRHVTFSLLFQAIISKNNSLQKLAKKWIIQFRPEEFFFETFKEKLCSWLLSPEKEIQQIGKEQLKLSFEQLSAPAAISLLFQLLQHEDKSIRKIALAHWNETLTLSPELEIMFQQGIENPETQLTFLQLLPYLNEEKPGLYELFEHYLTAENPDPETLKIVLKTLIFSPKIEETVIAKVELLLELSEEKYFPILQETLFFLGLQKGISYLAELKQKDKIQKLVVRAVGDLFSFLEEERDKANKLLLKWLQGTEESLILEALEVCDRNQIGTKEFNKEFTRLKESKNEKIKEYATYLLLKQELEKNLLALLTTEKTSAANLGLFNLIFEEVKTIPLTALEQIFLKLTQEVPALIPFYLSRISTPSLLQLLASKHSVIQRFTLKSLAERSENESIPSQKLRLFVQQASREFQLEALRIWLEIGFKQTQEDLQLLQELSKNSSSLEILFEANFALLQTGSLKALRRILELLQHPTTPEKLAVFVVEKLAELVPEAALPLLTEALQLRFGKIKFVAAVRILRGMKDKAETALPVLFDLKETKVGIEKEMIHQTILAIQESSK